MHVEMLFIYIIAFSHTVLLVLVTCQDLSFLERFGMKWSSPADPSLRQKPSVYLLQKYNTPNLAKSESHWSLYWMLRLSAEGGEGDVSAPNPNTRSQTLFLAEPPALAEGLQLHQCIPRFWSQRWQTLPGFHPPVQLPEQQLLHLEEAVWQPGLHLQQHCIHIALPNDEAECKQTIHHKQVKKIYAHELSKSILLPCLVWEENRRPCYCLHSFIKRKFPERGHWDHVCILVYLAWRVLGAVAVNTQEEAVSLQLHQLCNRTRVTFRLVERICFPQAWIWLLCCTRVYCAWAVPLEEASQARLWSCSWSSYAFVMPPNLLWDCAHQVTNLTADIPLPTLSWLLLPRLSFGIWPDSFSLQWERFVSSLVRLMHALKESHLEAESV